MEHPGRHTPVLAAYAGMHQPDQDVRVLPPPTGEAAFETVDNDEIGAPDTKITPLRASPVTRVQIAKRPEREKKQRGNTVDPASTPHLSPFPECPGFRLKLLFQDLFRKRLRHQKAVARNEPAKLRKRTMRFYKIRPYDAVTIEQDAILAGGRKNGAIADFGKPETVVGLPDMNNTAMKPGLPICHDSAGVRLRSIVGDQHFKVLIGLT
jgi:hypothetical protein